eukprot:CAMPEP_0202366544 /NCGR_PEP_ID=MMETSP1126-20121109/17114_1 /ASSEMBLY_ACC=CAM_ASM_000457 /TAXON_ID=3047 /ORGANISM="Dunaliella tertiolecta, Strain CCMP1320" /LENGTH=509 /DNA_ID=CAMNT_0048961617 /DNA_START=1182 /DNA_END=2712 /DNA_ORIENTATION=+
MSQSEPLLPIFQGIPPSAALAKVPRKQGTGMYDRVETQPGMGDLLADPSGKGARPASSSACMWLQASTFFKGPARILGTKGIKDKALQPLLEWGKASIPQRLHACTPVLLLATGGARSLSKENREQLLQVDPRRGLFLSICLYGVCQGAAAGTSEGAFSFVSQAYSRGMLRSIQGGNSLEKGGDQQEQPHQPVLGILDLGGSSLEVTTNEPRQLLGLSARASPEAIPINVTVGDAELQLSTTTYKHCGLMDTWDRSISLLLQGANGVEAKSPSEIKSPPEIKIPCLHRGFSAPYNRHLTYGIAPAITTVYLVGAPDEQRCAKLARALTKPCTTALQGQGEYVGTSGFYVVPQFLSVATHVPTSPRYEDMRSLAKVFLSMPWDQVQSQLGHHVNVEKYGLWGLYAPTLLGPDGFNLSSTRLTIGTRDMSWTLGAAIVEVSERLAESQRLTGTTLGLSGACSAEMSRGGAFFLGSAVLLVMVVLAKILISYVFFSYLRHRARIPARSFEQV